MKTAARFTFLVPVVLLLAGCSQYGGLPEFQREQTDSDLVSETEAASADIDPTSTRYVGQVDDLRLFIARGDAGGDTVCILIYRDDVWLQAGCGGGGGGGMEMEDGTLIETGDFSFPNDRLGGRERVELSESVTVIKAY